jgi:hypothetical protein
MDELREYRVRLLERLQAQPQELAAAIAAVPEGEWHTRRDSSGVSVHQQAAHLRDLEAHAFLIRLRRVLSDDNPTLDPYTSHRWSDAEYQAGEPMEKILQEFAAAREEALNLLRSLPPEAWNRSGFHPPSGQRTTQWWAERMYGHVREHLAELGAAAAAAD